jgi:hypothetical protein
MSVKSEVGPWGMVPAWILTVGLTPGEVVVYVSLSTFADRDGESHPRVSTIAERAGVTKRLAEKAIMKLRTMGIITTEQVRHPDGSLSHCIYTIRQTPPEGLIRSVPTEPTFGTPTEPTFGTHRTHVRGRRNTPENTPDEHFPEADASSSDALFDTPQAQDQQQRRTDRFGDFYTAYPRKVDRGAAERAWKNKIIRGRVDPDVVIAGARRYAEDPNRDPAFTKHPSTWLNAEAWLNEPEPDRSNGNGHDPYERPVIRSKTGGPDLEYYG